MASATKRCAPRAAARRPLTRAFGILLPVGMLVAFFPGLSAAGPESLLRLGDVERIGAGMLKGAEDVAVDREGRIFAGCEDGVIYEVTPDGKASCFVKTGGRPLGLCFRENGDLLVCDAKRRAVLSVTAAGLTSVLAEAADGKPLFFPDDIWAARDGTVYFTDATTYPLGEEIRDLIRGKPLGRLIAILPDGTVKVLREELYFPNGVTLSPDESTLFVAETPKRRILRMALTGEEKGKTETFVEGLPGFVDGIALDSQGNLLAAIPSVSEKNRKRVEALPGPLRGLLSRLPRALLPGVAREGMVLRIRPDRTVEVLLSDLRGETIPSVTNVIEAGEYLYLGFLYYGDGIARVPKPAPVPGTQGVQ